MASGGGKKGRKQGSDQDSDGNPLSAAIPLTVGAVLGAAVLYGAKKLYDYVTTKEEEEGRRQLNERPTSFSNEQFAQPEYDFVKTPQDEEDEHDLGTSIPGTPVSVPEAVSISPPSDSPTFPAPKGSLPSPVRRSLHDQLLGYYMNYVDIQESEMEEAYQVVENVKYMFVQYLAQRLPHHKLGELEDIGSAAEGMNVIRPEEFDVSVPIVLDSQMWELVDAGDTLMAAHGYKLVRRKNLEFFSPGSTSWDKYLMAGYLSPKKINSTLLELVNKGVNWGSHIVVRPSVTGHEVKLDVQYGAKLTKYLAVYFIPTVSLDFTTVTAKAHPKVQHDPSFEHLWRESFSQVERAKLSSVGEESCQITCLMIMKAVRLNHMAQLGMLSSYTFKTIVLHLLDQEDDWSEESICERFLDILKALEDYLRARKLPHYSCPYINLLDGISSTSLDSARDFITRVIGQNQFDILLKTTY